MRKSLFALAAALLAPLAAAHHSFAIYDMQTEFEFVGVVETLKFRNPHMSMTLRETGDALELNIPHERWPLPTYREMLFIK